MLEIRQFLGLRVSYKNIVLSLAQYFSTKEKPVAEGIHLTIGRMSVAEHTKKLISEGRIDFECPTLVFSIRNTLSNLRCGVWIKGLTDGFITVAEEDSAKSTRPYHAIGMKNGKIEIMELSPIKETLDQYEWIFSGVPILWEDYLYERMITECADHSHIWHIPRGNHPQAAERTKGEWERLHEIFKSVLYVDRKTAADVINKCTQNLAREQGYLHNAIGVDEKGRLLQLISIGSLEKLGVELQEMGARRALMVDNGGSIAVWFYPKGLQAEGTQLFSSPNHRSKGTAYLFLQLETHYYRYFAIHGQK